MKKILSVILFIAAVASVPAMSLAINRERGVKLGEPAPAFTYPDKYGGKVSLSDFKGKKVLLFFWVSWCDCREQLPLLQKYRDANAGKNFEIVSVSIDAQGTRYVSPIVDVAGVKYPVLLDTAARSALIYNFPASPAMYLIDEAGIVQKQYLVNFELSKEETKKELDEFLARPAADGDYKVDAIDPKARLAELEKNVAAKPGDLAARRMLAGMLTDIGDYTAALPHWETLVNTKGNKFCQDKFSLGTVNSRLGRDEQAIKYWKDASKCDMTNYIYMRTAQSYEKPEMFYTKEKMKDLYIGQ